MANTLKAANARPFNKSDWGGFSGAVSFKNNVAPAIRFIPGVHGTPYETILVADAEGVGMYLIDEDGESTIYYAKGIVPTSQQDALNLLNIIPFDIDPAKYPNVWQLS